MNDETLSLYRDEERRQKVKDELFGLVQNGEMTPNDAEAEADRLGVGPLRKVADPAQFDPMSKATWTLAMAAAWIVWRTPDAVRENWDDYRRECFDWEYHEHRLPVEGGRSTELKAGHSLVQRGPASLARLRISEACEGASGSDEARKVMSVKSAREQLWEALGEGLLLATGERDLSSVPIQIPANEWAYLQHTPTSSLTDQLTYRSAPANVAYRNLTFQRSALVGLWPGSRPPLSDARAELPPLMLPEGDGYMPLYCAAHWIASQGGSLGFDPLNEENWAPAYSQLLAAIASDRVRVVGTCKRGKETVPGIHFADCRVDFPFGEAPIEIVGGEDVYLRSYPYVDDQHWRGGFDDALVRKLETLWSRLMVAKTDIRAIWQFSVSAFAGTGVPLEGGLTLHNQREREAEVEDAHPSRPQTKRFNWSDEGLINALSDFRKLLLEEQTKCITLEARGPLTHEDAKTIGRNSGIPDWIVNAVLRTTKLSPYFYQRRKESAHIEEYTLENISDIRSFLRRATSMPREISEATLK